MQIFPTRMCNVTAWRHSTLLDHWLMALVGGGGGWGRSMYSAFSENCSGSYLSFSVGGVCGRSLTEGKILFTGKQTCSLYLVLWLCYSFIITSNFICFLSWCSFNNPYQELYWLYPHFHFSHCVRNHRNLLCECTIWIYDHLHAMVDILSGLHIQIMSLIPVNIWSINIAAHWLSWSVFDHTTICLIESVIFPSHGILAS